ncbi:MAG: hypothetical protein M0Z85_03900 [Gammaproteobacteria bacterium]|nr:hypothetical protein [Gammaproteobacteria bacterium]
MTRTPIPRTPDQTASYAHRRLATLRRAGIVTELADELTDALKTVRAENRALRAEAEKLRRLNAKLIERVEFYQRTFGCQTHSLIDEQPL